MNNELPIVTIDYNHDIKAYLTIVNIRIGINKIPNWFRRLMLKIFFGIEVERLDKDE